MDNQIINQVFPSIPINPPTNESVKKSAENLRYAGFLTRYVALAFDWQLLIFITLLIGYGFPSFAKNYQHIISLSLSLLFISYKTLTVKIYGKSIGKSIFV